VTPRLEMCVVNAGLPHKRVRVSVQQRSAPPSSG
jgi:hypothetical protein